MCRRFLIASFLGLAASAFGSRTEVLTSVADLNRAQTNLANASRPFDLTATVLYANRRAGGALMACDDSGAIVTMWDFCDGDSQSAREAWRMRLRGFLESNPNPAWARPRLAPACTSFEALAPAELPPPRLLSADQLRNFGHAGERVALTGVLRDVFRDEIDPNYVFLSLRCGKEDVSAALPRAKTPTCPSRPFSARTSPSPGSARRRATSQAGTTSGDTSARSSIPTPSSSSPWPTDRSIRSPRR